MKKLRWLFVTMLFCILYLGCTEENVECSPKEQFTNINILSNEKWDGISIFFDGRQVICGRKEPSPIYSIVCADSSGMMYVTSMNQNGCSTTENEPVWYLARCLVQTKSLNDDSVTKIGIEIYHSDLNENIDIPELALAGRIINVIPESDTAMWFGFKENPIRPYYDEFDTPAKSQRKGCYDGSCVAVLPIDRDEYCFDAQ